MEKIDELVLRLAALKLLANTIPVEGSTVLVCVKISDCMDLAKAAGFKEEIPNSVFS
jgi:hypothetical protein